MIVMILIIIMMMKALIIIMKRIYENYVNNRGDRLPPMKPPASYVGLNTPGGVQVDFPQTAGYIIVGQQTQGLCPAIIYKPTVIDSSSRTYSVRHVAVGSKATDSSNNSKYETH